MPSAPHATAAFDKLSLRKTSYTKKSIVIDAIKLDGLSNTVSKNKNGEWEHNKWLAINKKKKQVSSTSEATIKSKPILVSIKSIYV